VSFLRRIRNEVSGVRQESWNLFQTSVLLIFRYLASTPGSSTPLSLEGMDLNVIPAQSAAGAPTHCGSGVIATVTSKEKVGPNVTITLAVVRVSPKVLGD